MTSETDKESDPDKVMLLRVTTHSLAKETSCSDTCALATSLHGIDQIDDEYTDNAKAFYTNISGPLRHTFRVHSHKFVNERSALSAVNCI